MLKVEAKKAYGPFRLDVEMSVSAGETLALVGPTGCGKSTCLMIIAGLVVPDWGRVRFGERVLCDTEAGLFVGPEKRDIGMVFQDYALFPHMTAFENIAYGLKARGVRGADLRQRTVSALERVGIGQLSSRRPPSFSGGEKQRLALARAIALDTRVLLLDEPVSALDPHTRDSVRREIKTLIRGLGKTTVVVTHDPIDALTMGQRISVLENGKVQQTGDRMELLLYPKSEFVGRFMGTNFFSGSVVKINGDGLREINVDGARILSVDAVEGEVSVSFLPSEVTLSEAAPVGSSLNVFKGVVEDVVHLGDRVRVAIRSQVAMVAEVTHRSFADLGLAEGKSIYASFKATAVRAGG